MKKYKVEITEYLQKQIVVEANTKRDAILKIKEKYNNEEIVLDTSDFIDSKINVVKEDF